MSYDIDADKMLEVLRIGREKLSDKGTASAKKRVDPLRRRTGLPRPAVVDRMVASFRGRYGLGGRSDSEEMARAEELAATRFTESRMDSPHPVTCHGLRWTEEAVPVPVVPTSPRPRRPGARAEPVEPPTGTPRLTRRRARSDAGCAPVPRHKAPRAEVRQSLLDLLERLPQAAAIVVSASGRGDRLERSGGGPHGGLLRPAAPCHGEDGGSAGRGRCGRAHGVRPGTAGAAGRARRASPHSNGPGPLTGPAPPRRLAA